MSNTTSRLPKLRGLLEALGFSLDDDDSCLWATRLVAGEEVVLCFCPGDARDKSSITEAVKTLNRAGRSKLGVKTYLIVSGSLSAEEERNLEGLGISVTAEVDYLNLAVQSTRVCNEAIAEADAYIRDDEYVEQRIGPENRPASEYLTQWLSSPEGGLLVVLGHAGYGKTCLAYQVGRRLANEHLRNPQKPVPFVLPLQKHRYIRRFEELVLTHLQDKRILGFTSKAFAFLANNNRVVPILDGFDELAETGGIRVARETLKGLIDQLGAEAKVILTSRQAYFRHRGDLSLYGDLNGFLSSLQARELQPFGEAERSTFLARRGLNSEQAREIENAVKGLASEELLGSPLMLKILADEVKQGEKLLGSSGTEVFSRSLLKVCERELPKQRISWDVPKQIEFLASLADLMREEQAYELTDSDSWLRLVVESDVPGGLSDARRKEESEARVVQLKNHPLLTAMMIGDQEAVSFPHPLYRDYFVARKFVLASSRDQELRYAVQAGLPEGSIRFLAQIVSDADVAAIMGKCLDWKIGVQDIWKVVLAKCDLASKGDLDIRSKKLEGCLAGLKQFEYQNLSGLAFRLLEFDSLSFVGANFTASSFQACRFKNCAFDNSLLTACRFYDTEADEKTANALRMLGIETVIQQRVFGQPRVRVATRHEDPVAELVVRFFRRFIRDARGMHQRTARHESFFSGLGGEERKFTEREIIPIMLNAHAIKDLEVGVDVYEFNSDWQAEGDNLIWDRRVSGKLEPLIAKLREKTKRYNLV